MTELTANAKYASRVPKGYRLTCDSCDNHTWLYSNKTATGYKCGTCGAQSTLTLKELAK